MKTSRISAITARVTPTMKEQFVAKAAQEPDKTVSDVLRDLIVLYLSNHDIFQKGTIK